MDSPPALFALPGLTWVPDDRRDLVPPVGSDPPDLGEWSELESLQLALLALDPLMRALELAGYVTTQIQFGAGAVGSPPSSWVVIDPGLMEASEQPTASAASVVWPENARFAISFHLNVRRAATERSLAMPPQPLSQMPFPPTLPGDDPDETVEWATEGPNTLVFGSQQAVTSQADLLTAIDASEIAGFVEQTVLGLAHRWANQSFYGALDPFGDGQAPGLLWLFDPSYWDTEPPTWTGNDADQARWAAQTVLLYADKDPAGFIRAQVSAATRPDVRAATLGGLLELATGSAGAARNLRRDYFSALENKFAWSIEHGLGGSLDEGTFHDVCGQAWLGHPSRLRWLDVILYLAESRLLPFPGLVHAELDYAFETAVDPVDVVMTADGLGVEIRILGSEPIVVKRVLDIGFPVAECLTWEYTGADAEGIATLIVVAAPGVSVTGRENVESSWRLVVYRVQDHDLVPPWGEHIETALLEAPYDVGGLHLADAGLFADGDAEEGGVVPTDWGAIDAAGAEPGFRITPLPLGMRIVYPAAASPDDIEFTVDITVDEDEWDQRFSYAIEPAASDAAPIPADPDLPPDTGVDLTLRQPHVLVVRATWSVGISVRHHLSNPFIEEHYQRAIDIAGVDPPGVPVSTYPAEMELRHVTDVVDVDDLMFERLPWDGYMWLYMLGQMGSDIGIGMIPIVGDAVDIDEFLFSFATGTDKWGNPVTSIDRALMFGGMLLPFVSSGAVRGVKAALGG